MKKCILLFLYFIIAFSTVFAQRISVVGITPFQAVGRVTPQEAEGITNQIISELSSWGPLTIVQGETGADYIIRGTLSRQSNNYILSAETIEASSQKKLNDSRDQAATLQDISIFSFCTKIVEYVPFPNYLLGTWQSSINMPNGPIVCIIEFKSDRTVMVERYDTWEHKQNNALRYEGYGRGTYSYIGYANRTITVSSRQERVDAAININLTLEETLPKQTSVNQQGLSLAFNGDKTTFNFVNGSLPCGTNHDGPSVYPSASLGFINFTKIR